MRTFRSLFIAVIFVLATTSMALADNCVLASGAGYKKMVNALNSAYQAKTGYSIDLLFGNMARVTTLAKQSGKVDIVLGDNIFLKKADLLFTKKQPLGQGKLVLAFAKGSQFTSLADLDKAKRIALPDTNKAIYGKAARQFLQSRQLLPDIKHRLVEVSTVPQVFSYLATNEVDMGFINLTHALNVAHRLGGYVLVDECCYSPIIILAALLEESPHAEQAIAFLHFLKTAEAQAIMRDNGL